MNPNQMNVARAMVAQQELLDEARRSRLQAKAARRDAKAIPPRTTFHTHPLSSLLSLGLSGRR